MAALGCSGHVHSFAPSWRTVVGIATQRCLAFAVGLHHLCKPHIQSVMEVNIRQDRREYTSYKVANCLVEFSTSMPRTPLRPSSGDGLLGAPLRRRQPLENPAPREQGEQRGSSRTPRQHNAGGAPHL